MSTTQDIKPFEGKSWTECNAFVRSIRAVAWKEGKLRDKAWMADFASLCFSNEALRWHSRLPVDVQEDWVRLEAALLDHWSMSEDDNGQPTPAAAPLKVVKGVADVTTCGVLKVVVEESASCSYLACKGDACSLTETVEDALCVRLIPQSGFVVMEAVGAFQHSWIGIHWFQENSLSSDGSVHYARFSLVRSQNLSSSYQKAKGPFQLAMVDVIGHSLVRPQWYSDGKSTGTLLGAFVTATRRSLCLTLNSVAYGKRYVDEHKAVRQSSLIPSQANPLGLDLAIRGTRVTILRPTQDKSPNSQVALSKYETDAIGGLDLAF